MSVLTERAPAPRPRRRRPPRRRLRDRHLVLGCLALAALAHRLPAAPTYDPWAWIIWGREIVAARPRDDHGPVVEAAARPLHRRPSRSPATRGRRSCGSWSPRRAACSPSSSPTASRRASPVPSRACWPPAGCCWPASSSCHFARGNSEGLLVALCLWAVERHLDGRRTGRLPARRGRRAAAAGAVAVPAGLRAVADVARAAPRAARRRLRGAHAGAVVPARVVGLGRSAARRRARARARTPARPPSPRTPSWRSFRRAEAVLMLPVLLGAGARAGRRGAAARPAAAGARGGGGAAHGRRGGDDAGRLRRQPALRRAARRARVRAGRRGLDGPRPRAGAAAGAGGRRRGRRGARRSPRCPPSARPATPCAPTSTWWRRSPSSPTRLAPGRRPAPGGRAAVLRCRPVYTSHFEQEAVAWALDGPRRRGADPARAARHRGRARPPRRWPATRASGPSRARARGSWRATAAPRRRPNLGPWRPTPHGRRGRSRRGRSASRGSSSRSGSPRWCSARSTSARARSARASGSTRGCPSASPTGRCSTSPACCARTARRRSYYMLLGLWLPAGGRLRGGHPRALPALRRPVRARSRGGAGGCCSARARAGWPRSSPPPTRS